MSATKPHILVIRNDKLGDFMLAWPALALLRQQYPGARIAVLVPEYTAPLARICTFVDETVIDERPHHNLLRDARTLGKRLRQYRFDAVIALYTETRTALACRLAGIPLRIAPATKLAQFFSNRRLGQRRSQSAKPEHEYNTDLVRHYIRLQHDRPVEAPPPPFLVFDPNRLQTLRQAFLDNERITARRLILLHPGSGGSAINLNLEQYAQLIRHLSQGVDAHFVITAGPGESDHAQALLDRLDGVPASLFVSTGGLVAFARFIAVADLFISGSTGPLHIAGALDRRTVAFYPARRSATALRWQTTNRADRRMAFSPAHHTGENDMLEIDTIDCAEKIIHYFSLRKDRQ